MRRDDAAIERITLHCLGDAVHGGDRLVGPGAGGAFGREHDGVGPFIDGGGNVRDFGTRRHRLDDHRLKHLCRDDHRLADAAGGTRDLLLLCRHGFERQFDAQVTARDHQAVGNLEDLVEHGQGRRLLDLGHDAGAAGNQLSRFGHVVGALHEGQRDPVNADGSCGLEVGTVLFGQGRNGDHGVGQVHALPIRQHAAEDHLGRELRWFRLHDLNAQTAVVQEQVVAHLSGGEDLGVRQVHARGVARSLVGVEDEDVVRLDLHFLGGEGADADLRALQVGEDADGALESGLDGADVLVELTQQVMLGVAHVDAEHIDPGAEELFQHLGR